MNSDKNQNSDVDLSKFFEKEAAPNVRPVTIPPADFVKLDTKKQNRLIWVVIFNFIIGMAIFSYFIIKTNAEGTIKPVTMQKITAPVNYIPGTNEQYMPPLP